MYIDSVFWEVCYSPTAHITYHLKLPNLLYSIHHQLSNPIHLWGFFPRCEINAEHIIVYTVHLYSNLESEVNPAPIYVPTRIRLNCSTVLCAVVQFILIFRHVLICVCQPSSVLHVHA